MHSLSRKGILAATLSALALLGVSAYAHDSAKPVASPQIAGMSGVSADTPAADLRSALDGLLGEHVQLAAAATGAALQGRQADFEAAAGTLDANSVDISKAIGSVYGAEAGEAFLGLWRSHIGMVVDYTVASASKDKAKQDKAVGDLMQYAKDFAVFLNSASPALQEEAVIGLVKHHAVTLKQVIDAQAAGNSAAAFSALRMAYGHMAAIAEALADAIAKQFPEKFA
jgi:hypothetical protein